MPAIIKAGKVEYLRPIQRKGDMVVARRTEKLRQLLAGADRTAQQAAKAYIRAEGVLTDIEDRERRESERQSTQLQQGRQ